MRPVFLDTVGLLALWDATDHWHDAARLAFEEIHKSQLPVLTSAFVLLECANAAARRSYRTDLLELRDELVSAGALIEPTAGDVSIAWTEYRRGMATAPGVVDLVSFAIMRRLRIYDAFTNDRHFKAAGFQTLF